MEIIVVPYFRHEQNTQSSTIVGFIGSQIQWPGTPKLNYLNADGTLYLNENQNNLLDGNVDWPSANLRNVRVSVENTPSAQIENGGIFTVICVSKGQVLFSEQ